MIHLRPAAEADAAMLFAWRNDPITQAASRSTEPVDFSVHQEWLQSKLSSPDARIFIAEHDGKPVGVIRADHFDRDTELSWTVAPTERGQSIGAQMLSRAMSLIEARPLRAEIKSGNLASSRIVEKCGFVLRGEFDGLLVYELF